MKLLRCQIVNFGCLSDRSFSFDDGLNLFYAKNGKGKSTFAVFLKAMFYGLPTGKRSLIENERRRYAPWQGGTYGGSVCFEAEGVEYRLERFFGAKEKDDRFALYHLASGNLSTKYSENIGEELFAVDADGFERSLYISQRFPYLSPDNNSIRARLGALLDASEDLGDFERADDLLDEARRHYRVNGGRGLIADIEAEIQEKEEEIASTRAAVTRSEQLTQEIADITKSKEEVTSALLQAREKCALAEKRRLWEEQTKTYETLVEDRENAKADLLPYEEFFAAHLPSDEEIALMDTSLSEGSAALAQLETAVLSEDEKTALSLFREEYGETAPDETDLQRVRVAAEEWRSARAASAGLRAQVGNEDGDFLLRFGGKEPSLAECDAIREAASSLEEMQELLYGEEKRPPRTLSKMILPCLSILFAICAVLGFALSVLALAIPGVVLAVSFLAIFGFLRYQSSNRLQENSRLLEEIQQKQKRLALLLTPFGYNDKNTLGAAARFFADLERYKVQKQAIKARQNALQTAETAETAARASLLILLKLPLDTSDVEGAVFRLESNTTHFRLLLQKEKDLAQKREELQKKQAQCQMCLSAFLSHYPSLASLSTAAALDTVKQKMSLSKQALELYHRNRNRVSEYMKNTRFDPEQTPPAYLGELSVLRENELSLQNTCTELEKEHSVKQSEFAHLSDIIALLPMLLAECEALREKKAEAEHTLSLILLTKDILKEAKDDLSTRYLKNMELHFDRYYQKISEGVDAEMPEDNTRVTDYSIDTSLDISVVTYGEKRPVEVLSRGERDLVAFCARLSLMESIFTKEVPFLLLDDPFINLDDENYEKAAKLLASLSERFQIIYTVCSLTRLPKELSVKEL